jgi:hypothetical protein
MDAFGTFLYPYYILLYIFIYIILSTSPKLKRLLGMMVGWAIVSETNCSDYMVDFAASYSIAARPAAGINMNELAWHRPVSTDLMPCRIWPTAVLLRQPPRRKRREMVGTISKILKKYQFLEVPIRRPQSVNIKSSTFSWIRCCQRLGSPLLVQPANNLCVVDHS